MVMNLSTHYQRISWSETATRCQKGRPYSYVWHC